MKKILAILSLLTIVGVYSGCQDHRQEEEEKSSTTEEQRDNSARETGLSGRGEGSR